MHRMIPIPYTYFLCATSTHVIKLIKVYFPSMGHDYEESDESFAYCNVTEID